MSPEFPKDANSVLRPVTVTPHVTKLPAPDCPYIHAELEFLHVSESLFVSSVMS